MKHHRSTRDQIRRKRPSALPPEPTTEENPLFLLANAAVSCHSAASKTAPSVTEEGLSTAGSEARTSQNFGRSEPSSSAILPLFFSRTSSIERKPKDQKRKIEQYSKHRVRNTEKKARFLETTEETFEKLDHQDKLDCLINFLKTIQLNTNLVASLLSLTADFNSTRSKRSKNVLAQDELYEQALLMCTQEQLSNFIRLKRQNIQELNSVIFVSNRFFLKKQIDANELVQLPYPINSAQGLLNNFNRFFSDHLIQVNALCYEDSSEYTDQLFGYLIDKMKDHKLIPANEIHRFAKALNDLDINNEVDKLSF